MKQCWKKGIVCQKMHSADVRLYFVDDIALSLLMIIGPAFISRELNGM